MTCDPMTELKVQNYVRTISSNADVRSVKCLASQHKPNGQMLFGTFEIDSPDLLKYVFIRGDAVSVMPVINIRYNDDVSEKMYILVKQRRVCDGAWHYEFPAGMMDRDTNSVKVALKELEEETGLIFNEDQISRLNCGQPIYTSPGGCDEKIYLYKVEMEMNQYEYEAFSLKMNSKYINNGDEKIYVQIVNAKYITEYIDNAVNYAMLHMEDKND